MSNAINITYAHINRVDTLLGRFSKDLDERGRLHDQSKFNPIEMGPLQTMQDLIDKEGQAPFGSEEYRRRTALLGPMLEHHYKHNSHHPEHYANGIEGMDLLDLVEMFFDWKAASERGEDSAMGISYCVQKYNIPPMLESILRNTADRNGFAHK
jgi:hypothetical protein